MNFTTIRRKESYSQFMETFSKQWDTRSGTGFKWQKTEDMFKREEINRGVEGIVYKISFKELRENKENNLIRNKRFVLKQINLKMIMQSKNISEKILNSTPDELYKKFITKSAFNDPIFTELIASTLINQLVFGGICPNFTVNYHWDYNDCKELSVYNEFINGGDFHSWAEEYDGHTEEEWLNALFQVMIGLIALKRYFNMTHADFHTGNILIQRVPKGGYWEYKLNDNTYYLPNLGFQVLLHDFGFAWIPNKLYINWYYDDYLSEITELGKEFYDISQFIESIRYDYDLPKTFVTKLKRWFPKSITEYNYTKKHYENQLKQMEQYESEDEEKIQKLQKFLKTYPDIKKDWRGEKSITLIDKFEEIFASKRSEFLIDRSDNHKLIEIYDLNQRFDKSKIHSIFKQLIKY